MTEVDWSTLFKTFYETIRIKVACKDFTKIPAKRLYEMGKKLHLVNFIVESDQVKVQGEYKGDGGDDGGDGGLGDDGEEDDLLDDDDQPPAQDPSSSNNGNVKTPITKHNCCY